ncbi:MAG TPA: hypothetical protein DDX98_02105 [Bacteroidales bacterium]|nr:hypothetical protein [Bacteroidales bacterium]
MKYLFSILVLFSCTLQLWAQEEQVFIEDTVDVNLDIFAPEDPMEITLKFNIKEYQKTKNKGAFIPADLYYHVDDSIDIVRHIRIKARGNFRRQHCRFPPFWLNIKKAYIPNKNLKTTNKLKLITHCKGARAYNNYVLKEYLIYKIYNLLSPYSFRARLVRVKYIDTGRKNKENLTWAVMLEPEAMMAERFNATPIKLNNIGIKQTAEEQTDVMAMFQYMVSNTDFSVAGRHNVKLIAILDYDRPEPIPVPYDFDYSGLIDTYYAQPGENLPIKDVRERYYLGACRSDAQYMKTIDYFKQKKESIYALINSFEYLEQAEKSDMIKYLDLFYRTLEYDNFIELYLNSTCR